MTPRGLMVSGLLVVASIAPAFADGGKAPLQVSAHVVRSCRVTTDQPQVAVNCGTRPQPVQVSYSGAAPLQRTVTIHF